MIKQQDALAVNVNHHWNLFEKFQILKLRWAYWEVDLAVTSLSGNEYRQGKKQAQLKIRVQHTRENRRSVSILSPDILANQVHALNRFPTSFVLSMTDISSTGIYFGSSTQGHLWNQYESRRSRATIWLQGMT